MKRLCIVLLIAASLILSGCASAATPAPKAGAPSFSGGAPMIEAPAAQAPAPLSNDALKAQPSKWIGHRQ